MTIKDDFEKALEAAQFAFDVAYDEATRDFDDAVSEARKAPAEDYDRLRIDAWDAYCKKIAIIEQAFDEDKAQVLSDKEGEKP